MEILFYAVILLVGAVFVYGMWLLLSANIEGKKYQRGVVDEVPYKIEPGDTLETTDFSPHVVAVSEQFDKEFPATKRKYTKRNKAYWRKTGKIGKAKKAKKGKALLK